VARYYICQYECGYKPCFRGKMSINGFFVEMYKKFFRVVSQNGEQGSIDINPHGVEEFSEEILNWGEDQKRESS